MNVSVEFFMVLEVLFKGMEQNDAAICFIVGYFLYDCFLGDVLGHV